MLSFHVVHTNLHFKKIHSCEREGEREKKRGDRRQVKKSILVSGENCTIF